MGKVYILHCKQIQIYEQITNTKSFITLIRAINITVIGSNLIFFVSLLLQFNIMQFPNESRAVVMERFAQTVLLANDYQLDHCELRNQISEISSRSPMRSYAVKWIMKVIIVYPCEIVLLSVLYNYNIPFFIL